MQYDLDFRQTAGGYTEGEPINASLLTAWLQAAGITGIFIQIDPVDVWVAHVTASAEPNMLDDWPRYVNSVSWQTGDPLPTTPTPGQALDEAPATVTYLLDMTLTTLGYTAGDAIRTDMISQYLTDKGVGALSVSALTDGDGVTTGIVEVTRLASVASLSAPLWAAYNGPASVTIYGQTSVGSAVVAASAQQAVQVGEGAAATGNRSTAVGTEAIASASRTTAVGVAAQATGQYSVAIGDSAHVTTDRAMAIGTVSVASGSSSMAIGDTAHATAERSIGIGPIATAGGFSAVAIGGQSQATADRSMAIGDTAQATADRSLAIGPVATASIQHAIAIGDGSKATTGAGGLGPIAIGWAADARGGGSIALGTSSDAFNVASTAVGNGATATADRATAVGVIATASGQSSAAIGDGAKATAIRAIAIGVIATSSGDGSLAMGYAANCAADNGFAIGTLATLTSADAGKGLIRANDVKFQAANGPTNGATLSLQTPDGTYSTIAISNNDVLSINGAPIPVPVVGHNERTGSFVMTGYNVGQGVTLSSGATVVTTADKYDPAKAYWVEMTAEIYVTCAAGVIASIAAKRHDLSSLGIAGFSGSLPGFTSEQKISGAYAFYLPAGGLPGGNGVAANTLDLRIQLVYSGSTAPTARDGATAVRMMPVG